MRTAIRKIGNSQGVLIPKPMLAETGLDADAPAWPAFANAEDAALQW